VFALVECMKGMKMHGRYHKRGSEVSADGSQTVVGKNVPRGGHGRGSAGRRQREWTNEWVWELLAEEKILP